MKLSDRPRRRAAAATLAVALSLVGPPSRNAIASPLFEPNGANVAIVRDGRVTITSPALIHVGDHFAIVPAREQEEAVAVLVVFAVDGVSNDGHSASGMLPRGAFAFVGDSAVPTSAPVQDRLAAPLPWRPLLRLRATTRPIITVDNSGFALVTDLSVDYQFRAPLRLGFGVVPSTIIATGDGQAGSLLLLASAALSTNYFEAGVNLGGDVHPKFTPSGAAFGFTLRGGTLDGVHAVTTVILAADANGARLANLRLEFEIPVARRFALAAEVGGGPTWVFGTLGLKSFLRGSGGPGTMVLLLGFGGAMVSEIGAFNFGVKGAGPMLALGFEVRR